MRRTSAIINKTVGHVERISHGMRTERKRKEKTTPTSKPLFAWIKEVSNS